MREQSHNYSDIEQKTRTFLESLQKQGDPPIYTLSPKDARAVLSNLQSAYPIEKLPADIETVPSLLAQMDKRYRYILFDPRKQGKTLYSLKYLKRECFQFRSEQSFLWIL